MILINLLPHREAARKRRREAFYVTLVLSAMAGVMIAGGVYVWYAAQISEQQGKNLVLTGEIKRLESQIKDIATLQAEIAALRARQQAVEDLQADRNMPVHLLNELVRQTPDGVYVTSLKQENQTVSIQGVAQSNERVSELLRNLGNNSAWLARPELVEITAGNVNLSPRDQRRVSNFTMRVRLLRASEQKSAAAASAAGGAVPAASSAAAAPASSAAAAAAAGAAASARRS
ncbi:PilN domain-containing protein [Ramlibacter sp.]|uniref:PilN domain-containing protein n=1 Tax=Ramlibacter sp. TaxID=1917967 RepID=UPI002C18125E|nr:PilN domain-containing protein [Ramlibacter sp.]HWI84581.1 PilN domain-containing protein [Ramlibacter sp.]